MYIFLHLGKILDEISIKYGGSGGGHDGAASLTCPVEENAVLDEIVQKIENILKVT